MKTDNAGYRDVEIYYDAYNRSRPATAAAKSPRPEATESWEAAL